MDTKQIGGLGSQFAKRRLSRRTALKAGGLGLAASVLPGAGRRAARAQTQPPAAAKIDRTAVDAALPRLTALAEATVRDGGVPGLSLAVVYRDDVVLAQGFGIRSTAGTESVGPDTVFQLASLSKPVGSTVVSAIVGSGAATWDDRVIDHLPDFLLADPWATRELRITDFYMHRSGLGGDAGGDLERIGYDREAIFERLRYLELASSPRSRYAYTNIGMTVGGVAAAAAAGMSWEDASAALLYEPLGMTSTSSRYADFEAAANQARMHVRLDGAWVPEFSFNPDQQSPAGGVSSTANDMAQWLRLLLGNGTVDGKELIPTEPLLAARTPAMSRGRDPFSGDLSFYGYGWGVGYDDSGEQFLNHAGAFSYGARSFARLVPEQQLGIVVLANAFPSGVPDGLAASFFDLVRNGSVSRDWIADWSGIYDTVGAALAEGGKPYITAPATPAPAQPLSAYAGVYANDYVGEVDVVEAGGALTLHLGPERRPFPLTHFNHDTFTYLIDFEPPAPLTGITFVLGPDGQATAVDIDYFAGNGQARFARVTEG